MDVLARELVDGHAVDIYAAGIDLVEAHEQVDYRGLSGSGRADYGDLLAGFDIGGEVLYYDAVGVVAEANVIEADVAPDVGEGSGL